MMKKRILVFALGIALTGFSAMAEESPCRADVEKFCKDVKRGQGRIIECLKKHKAELSEACKTAKKELQDACKGDVEKYCSGVEHGEGRVLKCLKEHESELSQGCKVEGQDLKEMRKAKRGTH